MANRYTLHRSKLVAFMEWLTKEGFRVYDLRNDPISEYQVIQAKKIGMRHPLIVYDRDSGDHYTVADRDVFILRRFIMEASK